MRVCASDAILFDLLIYICLLVAADYLHICRKSDPKLNDCIKTSIDILRPFLVKGIPELDIPSIDPIDIGDLLVSENTRSNSNGIQITAKDIKSYGSSEFIIKSLEYVNLNRNTFEWILHFLASFFHFISRVVEYGDTYTFEVFFPHMHTEGTYDVSGQVLLLPIRGTGRFLGNFSEWIWWNWILELKLTLTHKIVLFFFFILNSWLYRQCSSSVRTQTNERRWIGSN